MVEQRTENPRVVGSIPTGGTIFADVAHLVERHLAKVEVASSSLVIRSRKGTFDFKSSFFLYQIKLLLVIFMKKRFLKLISITLLLTVLSSCSDAKVLKTKEITADIKQTSVVLESDIKNVDEFNDFNNIFSADFTIPGLLEGVIPQGLCYDSDTDSFIVSGYYEDGTHPSVIMIIDKKTKNLTDFHFLKNIDSSDFYGHAGGVACSESTLFLTSDGVCYTISLDNLSKQKNNTPITLEANFKLLTKGSFAAYNDGILWTGDFIESDKKELEKVSNVTTLENGETLYAYCEGYVLDGGLPSVDRINSQKNGYIPDYMLAIPQQVQGMAFGYTGKVILTTSYGRKNNSEIYVYDDPLSADRVGTYTVDSNEIDLYACSSEILTKKIIAPPMVEGATQTTDNVYIIFESGAAKYRNHGGKYPTDTAYYFNVE